MRIVVVKSTFNNLSPCCDVSQIRDSGRLQTAAGTACDAMVSGAHDDPDERYLFVAECSDGRLVEVLVGVQDPMPDHREAARAEVVARIRRGHFQTWRLGFLDDGDALEAEATGGARAP